MSNKTVSTSALLVFAFLALTACGGGGGGSAAAPPSPPPLSGSLDTAFDTDGKVTTDLGSDTDDAAALALQSDGKIVVVGDTLNSSGDHDFALARYNADGTLDKTGFGTTGDGIVKTGFPNGSDYVHAVAIYPTVGQSTDGMIVAAGDSYNTVSGDTLFALARYSSGGVLDTGFGAGGGAAGLVKTSFGAGTTSYAFAVAIQSDGKIVAAGFTNSGGTEDFALVRYNVDGSLDTTFGTGGKVTTDFFGAGDVAYAVAIQSDGKIVAAGYATTSGGEGEAALARYNTDGTLDTSFSTDGMVTIVRETRVYALAIQSDGKIVAAGYNGPTGARSMYVMRWKSDGTLDNPGFGPASQGQAYASFSGDSEARGVAIQSDGKIVVTGYAGNGAGKDVAFARFDSAGVLDPAFDADGMLTIDLGSSGDIGNAVAIQSNDKIVAVASPVVTVSGNDFALVRVNP